MSRNANIGIGLMGCGSMGTEIASSVDSGQIRNSHIAAVLDQDISLAQALVGDLLGSVPAYDDISAFLATDGLDIVVESASQAAIKAYGATILECGASLLMMSSGALLYPDTYASMTAASEASKAQIIVPSGAVGGIDALRAARRDLDSVTIVSTKPPRALSGAPGFAAWEDTEISGPTVVYEGAAMDAVPLFPANVNVAATVSLAGLGPQKTKVKVVADPASPGNVHEIEASGAFGSLSLKFVNKPHTTNPKTSYLAVLAATEALRAFCEPGPRIGA